MIVAEEKKNIGCRYKSFGTGLLRLCHLEEAEHIRFVRFSGMPMDKSDWYYYLTDEMFEISE